MEWAFGDFILNQDRAELIGPDGPVSLEKRPLDLLIHLVANADRVISKDEIVEVVWQRRIVSDATIATAVKQVRKAVGDSGTEQTVVKTIHGRGLRFVAPLRSAPQPAPSPAAPEEPLTMPIGTARPSVAVLRFLVMGEGPAVAALADAVPAELISSLSRMKWAQVIARGSSFRFPPEEIEPQNIGEQLGVRYLIAGSVEAIGDMLTLSVELISAQDGALIWSDRYASTLTDIQVTRHQIVASVIAAMELQVPQFEADHARRLQRDQFDAWSHFHLGLRHIYLFNRADNNLAAMHFNRAIDLDGEFARAHAGLSFAYWQDAFMQFGADRAEPLALAKSAADRALAIDPRDPFANFNMGRALWLEGDPISGCHWLERALQVNPNYAQCHYSKGLNELLAGKPDAAREAVKEAMTLSPLDPLQYAMLSVLAMSHIADEDFAQAAKLADRALHSPGAHFYISLVAAFSHELNGDRRTAEERLKSVLDVRSDLTQQLFFQAFPILDRHLKDTIGGALTRLKVN